MPKFKFNIKTGQREQLTHEHMRIVVAVCSRNIIFIKKIYSKYDK